MTYDGSPPTIKGSDLMDGDVLRARWFCDGIPEGAGTVLWTMDVSVRGVPEYQLAVGSTDGVVSSWVVRHQSGAQRQDVAEPGSIPPSESGVGTTFPVSMLPDLDESATWRAVLEIDDEQAAVFPQDGGQQPITRTLYAG